ncbi:hypothetical protein [Algoriphagus sp.]|uniref:hypothetical protein n=1 Tax=Algoriphagus sp. TaxID=1872435 RepID=UPI0025EA3638|nr:hypothetical protein [Algoriphagus sp.]
MKRYCSTSNNTWFLFLITELESQEESIKASILSTSTRSGEDESNEEADSSESFGDENEESSEGMVDPARTRVVDPARTRGVDPARTDEEVDPARTDFVDPART